MKASIPNHFCSKSYTVLILRYVLITIYRDHFFDTMERVRTAKEEKHYFPKASNQPAMVEQPIRLRYGYKINEAMLLPSKRLGIELGE